MTSAHLMPQRINRQDNILQPTDYVKKFDQNPNRYEFQQDQMLPKHLPHFRQKR